MSAEIRRESLLNPPALMFMSAIVLIAFWVLFPRQPAFRDPANLSAKDALSVAYLRVLVQSDPRNAPLRLSFVQVLTEAGMLDEADSILFPLLRAPESGLMYEIRMAELKLSLQQLYGNPPPDIETSLRARIAGLVPSLLRIADNDKELSQVVALAEQFGEPRVLAQTFEQLAVMQEESADTRARWLAFAANQRIAAAQPRLAAQNFCKVLSLERKAGKKAEMARSCLRAYLQAGIDEEAFKAAKQVLAGFGSGPRDAGLLLLAADIAQPLEHREEALAWLEEASRTRTEDSMIAERIVRLQVSMGLLADGLERARLLQSELEPGSERQRLLARLYDWNSQPNEALALWLSFARAKSDSEAEARAFALAGGKADHRALVQLLEAVMQRRKLTAAEAEAYVKAGLHVAQPARLEQQLRRHAKRFGDPAAARRALAEVLVLQGRPGAALAVYEEMPETQTTRQRLDLARLYEEAGAIQKSFDLLLRDIDSPDPAVAEAYWMLLAKVATQLGQDAHAGKAYEKALSLRPNDAEILEQLQRLAVRHGDEGKSERLARYGWERLQRVEDLQRLMRFSWKRKDWNELDHWLAAAEGKPSAAQGPDYWYFLSIRKMAGGDREGARKSLEDLLKLRGGAPEVVEALIWLLLADRKIDTGLLEKVVQPYHSQTGEQSTTSPSLTEALAAAEQLLGRPVQAAAWYLRTLPRRHGDFAWTLTVANNLEWAGCPANANHVRFNALTRFASGPSSPAPRYPERLAEYFAGSKDARAQAVGADPAKQSAWESLRSRWGYAGTLDNATYFALNRQRERLSLPEWKEFADAVAASRGDVDKTRKKGEAKVARQLALIADHLKRQPAAPSGEDMLPLSIDDVERANQWLAGEAPRVESDVNAEMDICRQTLAAVRQSLDAFAPDDSSSLPLPLPAVSFVPDRRFSPQ